MWQEADNEKKYGLGDDSIAFNPIKLSWDVHPDRDEKWYRLQSKALGKRKTAQELLCSFVGSGSTVIDAEVTSKIDTLAREWKHRIIRLDRGAKQFLPPVDTSSYIIGAYVATGGSKDYSAFVVLDLNTLEIVCTFKQKIKPKQFSRLLGDIGDLYNEALLIVEDNNNGREVNERLLNEIGYGNLYQTPAGASKIEFGWKTTTRSRPQMISALEQYLDNKSNKIKIYCRDIHDELITFIWKGIKAEHANGKHDDLVMSLAICLAYLKQYEMDNGEIGDEENIGHDVFDDAFAAISQCLDNPSIRNPYENIEDNKDIDLSIYGIKSE